MKFYFKSSIRPWFVSRPSRCRNHAFVINPLLTPIAKACASCGAVEPLNGDEISWPWVPYGVTQMASLRARFLETKLLVLTGLVVCGLLGIGSSLRWAYSTLFSPMDSNGLSAKATRLVHVNAATFVSNPAMTTSTETAVSPLTPQGAEVAPASPAHGTVTPLDSESVDTSPFSSHRTGKISRQSEGMPNRQKVEDDISRAISARAVSGVKVSYVKETAYLEGEVKTQSQKIVAEQAARSVPGVREVRSSIRVEWGNHRG